MLTSEYRRGSFQQTNKSDDQLETLAVVLMDIWMDFARQGQTLTRIFWKSLGTDLPLQCGQFLLGYFFLWTKC